VAGNYDINPLKIYLMILMRENPLLRPLEGVGPRNGFSRIKIITSRTILTTGTLIVYITNSVSGMVWLVVHLIQTGWVYVFPPMVVTTCLCGCKWKDGGENILDKFIV
jgi:hypothetical protein